MPCQRETFVLRLKKTRKESCESKIAELYSNLLSVVSKMMPEQVRKHRVQKAGLYYTVFTYGTIINIAIFVETILSILHQLKEYNEKLPAEPNAKKPRNPSKQFSWKEEGLL